jgi:hypothetical protein
LFQAISAAKIGFILNYTALLGVLIFTTTLNSSSIPEVASTEYSFVQRYTPEDNAKRDPIKDPMVGEKEELIRLWIESTSIYRMNN